MNSKKPSYVQRVLLVLIVSFVGSGVNLSHPSLFPLSFAENNKDQNVLFQQLKQDIHNSINEYKKNPSSWKQSSFSAQNIFQQVYDFESIKASDALCYNLSQLPTSDLKIFKQEIRKQSLHKNIPCLRSIAQKVAFK